MRINKPLKVLIIDDSEDDALLLARELLRNGLKSEYEIVANAKETAEALKNKGWDFILCDFVIPGFGGMEALAVFKEFDLDIPFIIVSGKVPEEAAIDALKSGAGDFISKQNLSRLYPAVIRELEDTNTRKEKKKALKELLETKKALEELNETLAHRVDEEVEKNRQKDAIMIHQSRLAVMGDMLSVVAHHWRQPLNALGLIIQDVKEAKKYNELTNEYIDEMISSAMGQINLMSKTIDDFRGFFRPEETVETFLLKDNINGAVELLKPQFKDDNITINTICDKDTSKCETCETRLICGYRSELNQVILNILLNAKDAIHEKQKRTGAKDGAINISFTHPKETNSVIISISDNGGGINANIANKMFEPYFTTKEQGKGVGIGLYMSKVIIEQNFKGKINIKNIPGGAEATIELPLPDAN